MQLHPAISCHILPYPPISCHILPYPAISCHILPYVFLTSKGRKTIAVVMVFDTLIQYKQEATACDCTVRNDSTLQDFNSLRKTDRWAAHLWVLLKLPSCLWLFPSAWCIWCGMNHELQELHMEALPENQCFAVLNAPRSVGERSFQWHGCKWDVGFVSQTHSGHLNWNWWHTSLCPCVVEFCAFCILYIDSISIFHPLIITPSPEA